MVFWFMLAIRNGSTPYSRPLCTPRPRLSEVGVFWLDAVRLLYIGHGGVDVVRPARFESSMISIEELL